MLFEEDRTLTSEERAAEMLLRWKKAAYRYRQILHVDLNRHDPNLNADDAPQLTEDITPSINSFRATFPPC